MKKREQSIMTELQHALRQVKEIDSQQEYSLRSGRKNGKTNTYSKNPRRCKKKAIDEDRLAESLKS